MYYIYMLRCLGESLYTGITSDMTRRMHQHTEKSPAAAKYTKSHPVSRLEALWMTKTKSQAAKLEAAIKKLPKAKKENLIRSPHLFSELFPNLEETDYIFDPRASLSDFIKEKTRRKKPSDKE